jgi:multisubunit Na+/H+ antiporter MnhG subunit
MIAAAIDVLLALAVVAVWLGCLGFARLEAARDRLHCVAFVAATAGPLLTAAAFVADGVSDRALKVLAVTVIALLGGAASSHATARALLERGAARQAGKEGGR